MSANDGYTFHYTPHLIALTVSIARAACACFTHLESAIYGHSGVQYYPSELG